MCCVLQKDLLNARGRLDHCRESIMFYGKEASKCDAHYDTMLMESPELWGTKIFLFQIYYNRLLGSAFSMMQKTLIL